MIDIGDKIDNLNAMEDCSELDEESLVLLKAYSSDEEPEIRCRAAGILVFADPSFSDPILLRLLEDSDELVRVNAADSLCNSNSPDAVIALKQHAVEDKWLVRGYCVLSITDIRRNIGSSEAEICDFLKTSLRKERNAWVRVHYYKELYELGDASCLRKLIAAINHQNYRVRIIAVKSLAEIANEANQHSIQDALRARLLIEETYAVFDSIERSIQDIEQTDKRDRD